MKRLWCLLFMAACAYDPPTDPRDNGNGPTGPGPNGADCNALHADPVLCLEFEQGMPTAALDGSTVPHAVVASDIAATTRDRPAMIDDGRAAEFDGLDSKLQIAGLVIDGSVTVEMWLRSSRSVAGIVPRRWLFDSRSFFMSHGEDRQIRCGINWDGEDDGDLRVDSDILIDDGLWHHVACTFDDAKREARIFIDGAMVGCEVLDTQIAASTAGTTIGEPPFDSPAIESGLIGALDAVHVYKRVLGVTEICDSAGQSGCVAPVNCPSGGQGGGQGGPGGPGGF